MGDFVSRNIFSLNNLENQIIVPKISFSDFSNETSPSFLKPQVGLKCHSLKFGFTELEIYVRHCNGVRTVVFLYY